MIKFIIALSFIVFISTSAQADEIRGIARVIDGNTLVVGETKIILFNIDAPESMQTCKKTDGSSYACGQRSTSELARMSAGLNVNCFVDKKNRNGYLSGTCFVEDMNLNKEMILRGWAVVYRLKKYDEDYLRVEQAAKEMGNGMWAGEFVMPWDWRNGVRK